MKTTLYFLNLLVVAGLLFAALGLPINLPTRAANAQGGDSLKVVVGQAEKADLSPALRDLAAQAVPDSAPAAYREIPRLDRPVTARRPAQPAIDPVVQSVTAPDAMPAPSANFEGVYNIASVAPPDTEGDIGYDPATGRKYYMQWVNLHFAVWDVTTPNAPTQVLTYTAGNTLWAGFGGKCATTNSGDPIVLFDQIANRWLATQFAVDAAPYYECIAISQTADPTGAWYRYAFNLGNNMNDYPHFGVWPDAYYMTDNQFVGGSDWAGAGVYAFERAKMLIGDPTAAFQYVNLFTVNTNFGGMLPSDLDGAAPPAGTPNVFMEVDDSATLGTATDVLSFWEFHVDWANSANTTFGLSGQPNFQIPVADFNLLCISTQNCVPQPGTTQKLDAIGDRVMHRLAYRNVGGQARWVVNHTVDAGSGRAAVRWYEVRRTGSATPTVYQQGTFAPADTTHRWMGSAALDHVGNLAIGYSASNATDVYPSLRYAGRLAGDPLGQLAQGEATLFAGSASQVSVSRWGDYSSLTLDPVDDCTFWYTNEYSTGGWNWRTRIGAFKFPGCTSGPQGRIAGTVTNATTTAPLAGAQVQATASPTQTGGTASGATGAYTLDLPAAAYTLTASLYGYQSWTSPAPVSVVSGTTTTQNMALTPLPSDVISGFVTDAATGWPLYAQLKVSAPGWSGLSGWSDPVTGYYSLTLVAGVTHTVQAQAWVSGYLAKEISVAPLSGNTTQNLGLTANAATCNAPGYSRVSGYFEDFEATAGGYTAGGTTSWAWGRPTSGPGRAHSGVNVWATNLTGNYNNSENGTVTSPNINLSAYAGQAIGVAWWQWLQTESGYDHASVEVSRDGGAIWTRVYGEVAGNIDLAWAQHSAALDPAYTVSNFRIRFRFTSDGSMTYPGWYVDDVSVSVGCVPQAGGLVVGNVYDANTAAALNGAVVTGVTGSVLTGVTADPLADDGFFTAYAPAGLRTFTATKSGGYYVYAAYSVTVPISTTIRQNFNLPAGQITVNAPASSTDITVAMNATQATNITLSNTGGLATNYAIVGVNAPYTPLRYDGPFADLHRHLGPKNFNLPSLRGIAYYQIAPTVPQSPLAGAVIATWPTGLLASWGAGFDTLANNLWIGNSKVSGGDDNDHQFLRSGTKTGETINASFGGGWAADMTYNPYTGMLWQINVGGDNCIYELDPQTQTQTGAKLCPDFGMSERGLAYDPTNHTFYAGSWNNSIINHFDANGVLLDSADVGLSIAGLAYNPSTQHLFVTCNGNAPACQFDVYVVDAGNNYDLLSGFNIAGLGDYEQAGLEISCDGHLWAVNQTTNRALEVDSGETGVCDWPQIPWLSWAPLTGLLTSGASQTVTLNYDASQVSQPGVYQATVSVQSNTPYAADVFGVKMTVSAPTTMGKLTGLVNGLAACDVNPTPMPNAVVHVESGSGTAWSVTTDLNGRYQLWTPVASSPLTVTAANGAGYEAQTAVGISVTAQQTTTHDFNLRLVAPCIGFNPNQLAVTLNRGISATLPLIISNSGALSLTFSLSAADGGFARLDGTVSRQAAKSQRPFDSLRADPSTTLRADPSTTLRAGISLPLGAQTVEALVVNDDGANAWATQAFTTALTNLGYTYSVVASSSSTGVPVNLLDYQYVIWAGIPSTGAEATQLMVYLDAGGRALVADNDFGYSMGGTPLYATYFEAVYGMDSGSDGVINGQDIMAGISADISSDPYPDNFTINGSHAVGIFANTAPRTGLAGLRIQRNAYKAIYLAWDFDNTGGPVIAAKAKTDVLQKAMNWLKPLLWLSADVTNGTVAPSGTLKVNVTFNAGAADVTQLGIYQGALAVVSNDLVKPTVLVPASMAVSSCAAKINNAPTIYNSVQAAVDASFGSPSDVVKVAGYCVGANARTGLTQTVIVTRSLTIQGGYTSTNWTTPYPITQPTTLDALNLGRVIVIENNANVTLENLNITGGNGYEGGSPGGDGAQWGGGVLALTSTLRILNSQVSGNTGGWGGGVANEGGALTLTRVALLSNTVGLAGGGLANYRGQTVVNDSQVLYNRSSHNSGGLANEDGQLIINRSVIGYNVASSTAADQLKYGAGGLGNSACRANSFLTINDSQVIDNANPMGSGGGGVANLAATGLIANLVISRSAIAGNTTSSSSALGGLGGGIKNGALSGDDCPGVGGLPTSVVTVTDSVIKNNRATNGGGIGNGIMPTDTVEPMAMGVTLNNTTISGNVAGLLSGGLTAQIGNGGGIFNVNGTVTAINSTVSGNAATSIDPYDPSSQSGLGGGIANAGAGLPTSVVLTHTTIASNTARLAAGLANITLLPVVGYPAAVTTYGTIIANNTAAVTTTHGCLNTASVGTVVVVAAITSRGYNLESGDTCGLSATGDLTNTNPRLGTLANNGGPLTGSGLPAFTHALPKGSPALNVIPAAACTVSTDQRGQRRPAGPGCDSGAYELQYAVYLPVIRR